MGLLTLLWQMVGKRMREVFFWDGRDKQERGRNELMTYLYMPAASDFVLQSILFVLQRVIHIC